MKIHNWIYLLLLLFYCISCETKKSFIYLPEQTLTITEENTLMYNTPPKGNKLQEYVLIKHPDSDTAKLKADMKMYFDSLCSSNTLEIISKREMSFYRYSTNTKPFIHSERKYKNLSREYIYDQLDDFLGKIVYFKNLNSDSKELGVLYFQEQSDTFTRFKK